MALKTDQDRVKTLLRDTITLLCKNGLAFESKFNIEAVIGVTIDDKDIFLVSINEIIKSETALAAQAAIERDSDGSSDNLARHSRNRTRRKRKHGKVKAEAGSDGEDAAIPDLSKPENLWESGEPPNLSASGFEDSNSSMHQEQPPAKKKANNKLKDEGDSDGSEDIVFIKQEMDESWPPAGAETESQDNQSAMFANTSGAQDDQNFPSISGMNLVPVGSQEGSAMWTQAMGSTQNRYRHRGSWTSTATSGDPSQPLGDDQQQSNLDPQVSRLFGAGAYIKSDKDAVRLTETHYIASIPPSPNKPKPCRRCRVCYGRRKRKDTRFYCPQCPTRPGLCMKACFDIYHEKEFYAIDDNPPLF